MLVVERGQDDRRTELAFVDQVFGDFVVAIHAQGEAGENVLLRAQIEIVRAFGFGYAVLGQRRRRRGANELRDRFIADIFKWRWREEARIAEMHRRAVGGL